MIAHLSKPEYVHVLLDPLPVYGLAVVREASNCGVTLLATNVSIGIKMKIIKLPTETRFRCSTDPTGYSSAGEIFGRTHSACFSPAAGRRICGQQRCEYVALRLDAPGFCRDGE